MQPNQRDLSGKTEFTKHAAARKKLNNAFSFQVAPAEHVTTKGMGYFRLLGRAAGMALFHNKTLNFPFAKVLLQVPC